MKYRLVMRWPSSDILPLVQEAQTATAAIKMCMVSMRGGCEIKSISRIDDAGATRSLLPRELVRLAGQEGYQVKFPPRVRRTRKTARILVCHEGPYHLWRRVPRGEKSIRPEADERHRRATGGVEAS